MLPATTVFTLLLSLLFTPSSSFPFDTTSYHIDCGSTTTTTDKFNTTWLSDRYASAGSNGIVSEPLLFQSFHEKTVRYFPISSGKKNCYTFPEIPPGRYYLRTFTVYDNYDGKSHSPSFDLSVEGTVVFSWRSPWPEDISRYGAYSDLMFYALDSDIDVCLYSIATDPPVIGSIEVIRIDPESYDPVKTGNDSSILVNYGRLTCGSNQWGPGFSNDTDVFGRAWQSDAKFRTDTVGVKSVTAVRNVVGAGSGPNYFPAKLYESAVTLTGKGSLVYSLPVDAKLDYLVWLHFAEIDVSVDGKGKRVFDVVINEENVTTVDIFKEVGGFAAFSYHYVAKNLSVDTLVVKLVPVVGSPLICGLENYAIVPADVMTVPEQASAMQELKVSLRVPERMGWNGDPCAPTSWDAWEGVTCHRDGIALVITQIDLGSQGLKGYISDKVVLLTNLVSLNLSSNSLGGTIPAGLGQHSLKKVDLSNNQITGSIPDSLSSSNLQLVILNGNKLEGQVPEELYSIGVHGGAIDLSGNKGLCGVPSLPDCPLFWKNGGLSNGGKIAIGISCGVVFLLAAVITFICIRRRRNDYDFGLPQELMSLAAKRNKYQRQKSLMALEMESQHAKGFIPSYN
ncbi:putative transferase [Helianthus annuus]|uniref:Putative di-glucose binding protein with Leucine-rich repeat domain-containing protein n=1 Tax=Helianthus annuus TaxID=4232 RepID=A0A251RVW0_HELAN|nr:receptor-like protein 4 [Helianthus annuus]KAF5757536.1 putative transferase [Helianthus annuus]KAJ0430903.1 putative transferase [Helianthus annuus]KAJ0449358.1 putative transferase [Helianthus annuus]KAJ0638008.1 putative transferase [Helianthus annuus]KAJ0815196.1 putative transferase [Helianthus annuus]